MLINQVIINCILCGYFDGVLFLGGSFGGRL